MKVLRKTAAACSCDQLSSPFRGLRGYRKRVSAGASCFCCQQLLYHAHLYALFLHKFTCRMATASPFFPNGNIVHYHYNCRSPSTEMVRYLDITLPRTAPFNGFPVTGKSLPFYQIRAIVIVTVSCAFNKLLTKKVNSDR